MMTHCLDDDSCGFSVEPAVDAKPMWRRVSCEQQSDAVSELLTHKKGFGHAVVEPSCRGVLRCHAMFRASSVSRSMSVGARGVS